MNPTQLAGNRSESIQRMCLMAGYACRPWGLYVEMVVCIVNSIFPDASHEEVSAELRRLSRRRQFDLPRDPMGRMVARLTRKGAEQAERINLQLAHLQRRTEQS